MPKEIALIGNSNSGKSHIFNRLTGYNRTTGNWDGVSVDIKKAPFNKHTNISDLPGIPSLDLEYKPGTDHSVAHDYIKDGKFDFLINVLDATCIEKGLHLTLQLLEKGIPTMVVINKSDLVKGSIDHKKLEERLGLKVIIINTISKDGLEPLLKSLKDDPHAPQRKADILDHLNTLNVDTKEEELEEIIGNEGMLARYKLRADVIRNLAQDIIIYNKKKRKRKDILDKVLINRYLALPIFLSIMFVGIWSAVSANVFAGKYIDIFEAHAQSWIIEYFSSNYIQLALFSINSAVLVIAGLIPALFAIYLFLSLLEESGYMARVIIVMDGWLQKLHLDGKAFIPLILGFGCNVTALMSLKVLESKIDRIKLALAMPFVNCNARLAIYTILTIFFFPEYQALVIFSLYILSIIISFAVLYFAKFIYRKAEKNFLIFELPKYGIPSIFMIFRKTLLRVRNFVREAAAVIVMFSFVIILFNNIMLGDQNYAKKAGLVMNKAFTPIGAKADAWETPYIMLSGLVAKEAMIGTINGVIDNHSADEGKRIQLSEDWKGHYAILVFIMLYFPCVSVFAVQRQQYGTQLAVTSVLLSLAIAYSTSIAILQVLRVF
mgnify:CR=1 FL=1